jgi:hypothetical protein
MNTSVGYIVQVKLWMILGCGRNIGTGAGPAISFIHTLQNQISIGYIIYPTAKTLCGFMTMD